MAKVTQLKYENIHRVRTHLYDNQLWTKNDLARQTGISPASMTTILQDMVKSGEVDYIGDAPSTGGRKSKQYRLNPDYVHFGLMVLQTWSDHEVLKVMIMSLAGNILNEDVYRESHLTLDDVFKGADQIQKDQKVESLIISIPGVATNGFISISDVVSLRNVDLGQLIKERYGWQCHIENDVNIACIGFGDHYSGEQKALIYQPERDYVGCGIMIDGKLYNGAHHFAGELSYLPLMSRPQQKALLKEDPLSLLQIYIGMLSCVIDPELIGVYSEVVHDLKEDDLLRNTQEGYQPRCVILADFQSYLYQGLYAIGKQVNLERMKENE
ncbi:MAG: ROK family protein [Erysipelotrichaceae bacterium]|nr:ROK family protein [Erysipelotrichaceae bacterium]